MTKNKPLMLFVGCFILPFVLAMLALQLGWVNGGGANHGELMSREVHLAQWRDTQPMNWSIVMAQDANCEQTCSEQRRGMESIYLALGKLQDKVGLVVLSEAAAKEEGMIRYFKRTTSLDKGSLYLVDHMGLVVLHYPYLSDPAENRLQHKGLIKDLKKLLNYSRSS